MDDPGIFLNPSVHGLGGPARDWRTMSKAKKGEAERRQELLSVTKELLGKEFPSPIKPVLKLNLPAKPPSPSLQQRALSTPRDNDSSDYSRAPDSVRGQICAFLLCRGSCPACCWMERIKFLLPNSTYFSSSLACNARSPITPPLADPC